MRGFTLIEVIFTIGVLGVLVLASAPSIMNVMQERELDLAGQDVLSSLQTARFQAVSTKLNHRVFFSNATGSWLVRIERETTPGTWTLLHGSVPKLISPKITFTLNLPVTQTVVFSATGFIRNYDNTKNSVILDFPKLKRLNQPDRRLVRVYAGGSIQYAKATT